MKPIEELLRKQIGLDVATVGSSLIERTVRLRMKSLGVKKPEEYREAVEASAEEWEELLESVVVTETWFFRDRDPFTAFIQLACEEHLPRAVGRLRILSVPCSSGEEPYSLAMALLDAGVPRNRFVIDAVDISARTLERARLAVYGRNSFRGKALEFRDRHFTHTQEGFVLKDSVRECVEFHRGNLLGENFFTDRAGYDFVFCRNLLIYFDRDTQAKALAKLHRLLSPLGVLFVGPAEMPLVSGHGFVTANLPMAFASRKAGAPAPQPKPEPAKRAAKPTPQPAATRPVLPRLDARIKHLPAQRAAPPPDDLAEARQLADAGKLTEAVAICETHLKAQGPSAQAYYLLGLLHDAIAGEKAEPLKSGKAEISTFQHSSVSAFDVAMDYYRKALYLDPNHHETLLQMSLLLEKNGDPAGARTLKRRAERVKGKS